MTRIEGTKIVITGFSTKYDAEEFRLHKPELIGNGPFAYNKFERFGGCGKQAPIVPTTIIYVQNWKQIHRANYTKE